VRGSGAPGDGGGRAPTVLTAVRLPRRRLIFWAGAAGLAVGGGVWVGARVAAGPSLAAAAYSLRGRVVAVDPGHGGIDPGAIGPYGVNEDTIVLAVSLRLAAMLERAGAIAVLTRTGASDVAGSTEGGPTARKRVDLRARVDIINAAAPDVVVSVHANHFSSSAEHGAQTFYSEGGLAASKELALLMQQQLVRVTHETRRKVSEHIDHYVLNHTDVPGVTVEIGFLSNPREARLLAAPAYQERLAYAMYAALAHWFARLPSRVPPPGTAPAAAPWPAPPASPASSPASPASAAPRA
jgi:N-acetylmuramoyl-L-alanine amidase